MQFLACRRPDGAASPSPPDVTRDVPCDVPRVVCLHGFTHDATTWRDVAVHLAGVDVVALDLPGHGRSGDVAVASLDDAARLVCDTVTGLGPAPSVHLVGYSLGGRVALHAACAAPSMWRSVTLVSASPGIVDLDERARRARDDDASADGLVADPDGFLTRWEALPLFAGLAAVPQARRAELAACRRAHDPVALGAALRTMSVGRQRDLRPALAALPVPVHCVAGARDPRYVEFAREISVVRATAPTSVTVAAAAGHVVHLEAPGVVAAVLSAAVRAAG